MSAPTDAKPSPLFFNSARGSRQSPFGRPGSIRQGSPSTARPSTPTSSPLKPKETPGALSPASLRQATASNASQNAPPWLKTGGAASAGEPPGSPSQLRSPSRELRSPSREPLSPGPQLLSPSRDRSERPEYARNMSSSTNATVRPLSTASLAAKFDGGRERSSTPPLLSRDSTTPVVEEAVEMTMEKRAEKAIKTAISPSKPVLVESKPVQRPPARPPMIRQTTNDALSKLPPPLLHSMRESFSVMDRDDDGHVNAADVADMLSQLGLSATPSTLATYFNGAQSINLATYLNTLSDLLGGLSRPNELSAAFEAFDDGDDGQIDLAELKDALLHTAPDAGEHRLTEREIDMVVEGFSGRRAFGKGGKGLGRGEVFRYQEFMASLTGGGGGENGAAPAPA
ncbi:EF-hand [Macroventuria anomochaeta]|uniref:EF-hand n=1 Tax=Macroventuria anomochaeta TaxID=301207 RepID=A0ACB6SFZ0_9PLEO|nr:EF-hand [Macroventuria anomochaeta]KAF2632882.1 EF-hand [Macroventuria anomochaeta]